MKKHSFMTKKIDGSRSPVIFPKALVFLKLLGENIKLAYKRRGTANLSCQNALV